MCDRILVFYAGKIVEEGSTEQILTAPRHPYTQMLLRAIPNLERPRTEPLESIPGAPPNLFEPPLGCSFAGRCPYAHDACKNEPPFKNHLACWKAQP